MPSVRHRDFPEESRKLGEAVGRVRREQSLVSEIERRQYEEVMHYRHTSGGAFSHEWFVAEKLYAITSQKVKDLGHAEKNPYFARVDFRKSGEAADTLKGNGEAIKSGEAVYIGKWGVTDAMTRKPYIYDWRSPIANLYYGAQVGPAEFMSPGGLVTGDMALKRIFSISSGELHSIIDADIVTQDEYLHDVLSDHADARLRDIVTTIQQEQNDIIRHNYKRPMVVQGVAGAGKTTVALHRITWLLYTYQQTMGPENLMVIAPTPLFLNYISAVLPELGAENVLQTTFYGLGELLTGKKLPKLDDSGTLLRLLSMTETERETVVRVARLKGSLLFKECLARHVAATALALAPDAGLRLGPAAVCTKADIARMLTQDLSPFPLARRLPQLKKMLAAKVKGALASAKFELEKETARRANLVRERMKLDTEERRDVMQRLYAARNQRLAEFDGFAASSVDDCMASFPKFDLMAEYRRFLSPEPIFDLPEGVDAADWQALCADSLARLDARTIETADIAPLIYLNGLLFGHSKRLDIHHTVLDEAQDFSAFQFDLLSGLTQNASFTIVGDLAQGIHGYRGVESWRDMMDGVFGAGNADYHELVTSYRNTIEIMDFAGKAASRYPFPGQKQAKPVLRHGLRPEVVRLPDIHPEAAVAAKVQELLDAGMKTVAVVHKLPADCESLYRKLKGKLTAPLSLYRDGDDDYRGGAMVLPAHMVKGLEFDAIVLADVSEEIWPDDALHCRLLYVCLTRPLHRLVCFRKNQISKLLENAVESSSASN